MLTSGDVPPQFDQARIRAEHDDHHYAAPSREGAPPGVMHPVAEVVPVLVKTSLDQPDLTHLEAQ